MRTWIAIAATLAGCYREAKAPPQPAEPVETAVRPKPQVARGAYLALIAGCKTCHTKQGTGMDYAGGTEIHRPDGGVIRMSNITQDRTTGIGAWTDAQIAAAIRIGVRPDGNRLLPIMPYSFYNHMTDADAVSLVAFLRTIPPVANQVARTEVADMKPIELGPPVGNIDPPDALGHGEYLADLMHCAGCHTPQQGPFSGKPFVGGEPMRMSDGQTIMSANITSDIDTGLGRWTEDDIVHAVREMRMPNGDPIRGPMAMYKDAWSHLTDDDAHALGLYIKSLPPVRHDVDIEQQQPSVSTLP